MLLALSTIATIYSVYQFRANVYHLIPKGAFQPKDCATISTMGTEDMCKVLHMKKKNKVLNQGCV